MGRSRAHARCNRQRFAINNRTLAIIAARQTPAAMF
jgi:hypothetical protein